MTKGKRTRKRKNFKKILVGKKNTKKNRKNNKITKEAKLKNKSNILATWGKQCERTNILLISAKLRKTDFLEPSRTT
jgi:hypothetical protein